VCIIFSMYKKILFGSALLTGVAGVSMKTHALVGKFADGIIMPGTAVFGVPVTLVSVISALMRWMLSIIGIVAIIAFVYAGIMYMTSAGSDEQAEQAKKIAKYALFGVIVALGSMIVLQAFSILLKGESQF